MKGYMPKANEKQQKSDCQIFGNRLFPEYLKKLTKTPKNFHQIRGIKKVDEKVKNHTSYLNPVQIHPHCSKNQAIKPKWCANFICVDNR